MFQIVDYLDNYSIIVTGTEYMYFPGHVYVHKYET
jgi:hypothetical protein